MKRLAVFLLLVVCFASRAVAFGFAPSTDPRPPDVLGSVGAQFAGDVFENAVGEKKGLSSWKQYAMSGTVGGLFGYAEGVKAERLSQPSVKTENGVDAEETATSREYIPEDVTESVAAKRAQPANSVQTPKPLLALPAPKPQLALPAPEPQLALPEQSALREEFIRRQSNMLADDVGYNVSPENWFTKYDTLGTSGTSLTDRAALSEVLGDFKLGRQSLPPSETAALEQSLGLEPGSLSNGFRITEVRGIPEMNPRSPLTGNPYFRGPDLGLPGGGPELKVEPIKTGRVVTK